MKSIIVPATTDHLDEVTAFVDEELEANDCPMKTQLQIELAVEEIFVNIASYAYQPGEGDAEVRCEVADGPMRVTVQFLDSGMPYDPLARGEADISQEALMAREGGLGIHLVKKTMDEVHYVHEDGKNVFTMVKNF